jgi:hypothetical protein
MKHLLFLSFGMGILLMAKGQSKTNTPMEDPKQDSIAISRVLETYFKGIYTGDIELLKTVYYPGTLLFGDVKGQPYAKTLEQYLDGVAHRQSPKDSGKPFKSEIIGIDVVNSIAVARVRVKMYDFNYQEFLSFHKLDNHWLIVNKMISDISE